MADDRIEVEIVLDDGSIQKGFSKVKNEAKKSAKSAERDFSGLRTTILGLGTAFLGVFAGRKIIDAAKIQEDAVNALNTSLKNAGTFSDEASQRFQDLASSLQATTTFGDETILQFAALARNFTKTNEEAEALTKASLDLSAATGMSLESAVKNLGKTYAGLTGELGESVPALRNLTAEQLKSGEAIKLITDRFGGAAQAQVNTFSGRISQLSNSFGDLLEELGFIITKSPVLIRVFGVIGDRFKAFIDSVSDFRQSGDIFGDLLRTLIKFADGVNMFVIAPLEMLFNLVKIGITGIQTAVQGVIFGLVSAASKVVGFFSPEGELAQSLRAFTESSGAVLDTFAENASQSFQKIGDFKFTAGADALIMELEEAANKVDEPLEKVANAFTKTGAKVSDEVKEMQKNVQQVFQQGLGNIIKSGIAAIGASLVSGQSAFDNFGNFLLNMLGDMAINVGFIISGMGTAIQTMATALTNWFTAPAAVAAGIALIALGGALKAMASGPSGGSASGSVGGGAGGGLGISEQDNFADTPLIEEEDIEDARTGVVVNVEGTVLDPAGVGQQIVDVLNEAGFTNGARTIA